jgi:hypothetical protein
MITCGADATEAYVILKLTKCGGNDVIPRAGTGGKDPIAVDAVPEIHRRHCSVPTLPWLSAAHARVRQQLSAPTPTRAD